ncbi:MAG TPA: hypothetical protein VFB68_05310 [Xanthobacteraceae bacterium]|nr:hypothetical protein [Xanthobacteraceae bacterium]
MCGDLEEDEGDGKLEEMLYARFVAHARALLAHAPPPQEPADNAGYMEKLFTDALSRAVKDCEQTAKAHRYERMIAQPVVFARLAGFLAAHMSLGEDPLRRVMEALMLGYSEAEALDRERRDYDHGDVAARS